MTAWTHPTWPPRPSTAAYNLEGLSFAIHDLVHGHGSFGIADDRREYLKLAAMCSAAELYSYVLARWFSTRMGEDEDLLQALEDRFEAEGLRAFVDTAAVATGT